MKQNNRFCVLALTAVLALTLTACSETADGSAASGSTQTTPRAPPSRTLPPGLPLPASRPRYWAA